MAQIREVRLIDDLDGVDAVETIEFALDGKGYEIDLSGSNATKLRGALSVYIAGARRAQTSSSPKRRASSSGPTSTSETGTARQWLKDNGHQVSDRGRLSEEQWTLYRQRNVGADVVDEPIQDQDQDQDDALEVSTELDTSDEAVLAWHKFKTYKVPADGKVNGLMRTRYMKAHAA